MRDLWEQAEERFIEHFMDEHDREPTEDEISEGVEGSYQDLIAELTDQVHDAYKDSLYD